MQINDDEWISPSFNSYSTAAKSAGEAAGDVQLNLPTISENDKACLNDEGGGYNFEFELTNNEMIKSFPIFNGELIFEDHECASSSSESDEMETVPPGSYCVWKPEVASPSTCKKSKSTGFGSKRWKLRDLLRRSNSEGKDSFVFLTSRRKNKQVQIGSRTWSLDIVKGPTPISEVSKEPKALFSSKKSTTMKGLASGLDSSPDTVEGPTPVLRVSKVAKTLLSSKKSTTTKGLGLASGSDLSPDAMESPTPVSGVCKATIALLSSKKSTNTKKMDLGLGSDWNSTRRMIYTPANRDIMGGNETPNRSKKGNSEMPKRKSYLPYRQDLVGFFTTVNSLGRNFSQLKMK